MPSSRISKTKKQLRRIFRFSRKKKKAKAPSYEASASTINQPKVQSNATAPLPWSPEDIMNAMNGLDIPVAVQDLQFLLEVGQVKEGWVMDFSMDKALVTRYEVPERKSKKAPSGPPKIHEHLQSLPWVWYKDRKVFSKIETGKMSDTVAYVTGKIAVSGDSTKFDLLETIWKDAKEIATERKKKSKVEKYGFNIEEAPPLEDEDEEEEEEDVDEEARIIATFKPEKEPKNPFTESFWRRHFGTDALVSAYLFLISSAGYQGMTIIQLNELLHKDTSAFGVSEFSQLAHSLANAAAAIFFLVGSAFFVKLSYPEEMMIMMYRAVTVDPNTLSFMERYFTANEMLIALWLFCLAFLVPYFIVMMYELLWLQAYTLGINDAILLIVVSLFSFIFNIGAMPDGMRMNDGKGSSFFFDYFWAPLLRLKSSFLCQSKETSEKRVAFWHKHLGNDMLATAWIFAVSGVGGSLPVIPSVIEDPGSLKNWLIFIAIVPFGVGSLLLLRSSYPETMNSSFCFKDDPEEGMEEEAEIEDLGDESNLNPDSITPLLV